MSTLRHRAQSGVYRTSPPASLPVHDRRRSDLVQRRKARALDPRGSTEAPTWVDYRLDLVGGWSEAPRIPAAQLERLYPDGIPRSWELLVERPQRPVLVLRMAGALISAVLGTVALLSPAVAGVVGTVGVGLGEMASIVGHLLGIAGASGTLGVIGRMATVLAVSVTLVRLGWRATHWGVAPIGDNR